MDFYNLSMEGGNSWSDDESDISQKGTGVFIPNLGLIDNDGNQEENSISIDILPDDMHEKILSRLPLSVIFKASCVCKKWNEIIHSKKFTLSDASILSDKTWYFMFTSSAEPVGYLYDPGMRKWYNFELPFMVHHTWKISQSCGLVCFMDDETSKDMYICNPITKEYECLKSPSSPCFPVYNALAFSVGQSNSEYTISVIRSMQASDDFFLWNFSVHVYNSNEKTWLPPVMGAMRGWRPGDVSVICNNVLYVLVFCTRPNEFQNLHGLVTYDLASTKSSIGMLRDESVILAPCALTCGRLMNVQRKVVLVGGIGRPDRPGVIKGIGIWVLDGNLWTEITRMPHKFVQGFGELDDVFASSGGGDLIYIQSYGGTALLVYDMDKRQWFWSQKCLMHKKFPLEIFSGFCFEPRLQFM
ncbi:F-box/kelch-repeat protein At3g61590-like [Rutidosis leptorrhynchoides]|uniref:F-box/kelch-repeat protein At3g61590-like n=1 Tax=Rutidosis leptorrhynchoides TaxID=125765 RepID=UPI003A99522C